MKALMQALTIQLDLYSFRLITTKCLNTAVSFFYLFFGDKALKHTVYCDVHNVQQRNKDGIDNNSLIADRLRKDILRRTHHRYVYYLMLADGPYIMPDGTTQFFVGHVFCIEKVPNGDQEPFYYLYQSYIDQYTFAEYVDKYKSILISQSKLKYYMDMINKMVNTKKWDQEFVDFWKDFTKVDTSHMLGGRADGAFLVCYQRLKYTHCVKNVAKFVDKTLGLIPHNKENEIFGDPNIYDANSNPLTNGEIRQNLRSLKSKMSIDNV